MALRKKTPDIPTKCQRNQFNDFGTAADPPPTRRQDKGCEVVDEEKFLRRGSKERFVVRGLENCWETFTHNLMRLNTSWWCRGSTRRMRWERRQTSGACTTLAGDGERVHSEGQPRGRALGGAGGSPASMTDHLMRSSVTMSWLRPGMTITTVLSRFSTT